MPSDESPLLIIAISGRALAQSARRAGHRVTVLDCFGDQDTRAVAQSVEVVTQAGAIRFHRRGLLEAVARAGDVPIVYGSGFEGRIALLDRLGQTHRVYGNRAETVAAVRDPARFFPLLDRLGIPHPEIAVALPASQDGWLVKQLGSAGGTGVRLVSSAAPQARSYFQRLHAGVPMSVLFLADGRRARILGINEQWTAPRPGLPFLYGGAVSRVELPATVAAEVAAAVERLVGELGLVGLNGLDFLLQRDEWSVLELNPRPTATVELYDADYADGLIDWHIRASQGELPEAVAHGPSRAAMVIHSPCAWTVPDTFHFPVWCADLPTVGMSIGEGDPVCTVHAEAESPGFARALVLERQHHFERLLGDFQD